MIESFFRKSSSSGKPSSSAGTSKEKTAPKKSVSTPWVEKYRPRTIEDIVEQAEVVTVFRKCMDGKKDFPNMLLYGPPGTGKTSSILAAVKEMFGRESYKTRILELNASDERGIQVVRDKVKQFAQQTVSNIRNDGQPCPPFKIVILDEADSMTQAAQAALRRTMERESKTTRFCLICNYISRIIKPLSSRCMKFRFKPISEERMMERLRHICEMERVQCDENVLQALVEVSGGDMRHAITCLQSCSRLKDVDQPVTKEDVLEVTGLLEQLLANVIESEAMTDKQKELILDKLALCSWRISDGASEYIELLDLCCTMMVVFQM
ncbi:replication factor C subunit 4 isoform X2 [Anabrus simplex]|uniref:replication factor C subunit 4 isoform X2 n=1 Tax=Anabrus simplex TaxID=316456 RepID=UPI0034DD58FC